MEPLRVVKGADDRLQDGQIAVGPGVFHATRDYFGSRADRPASITGQVIARPLRPYALNMSRPVIPGYLEPSSKGTLADLWTCPTGVPAELWPVEIMRTIRNSPTDWMTIAEHHSTETGRGGSSCVLVQASDVSSVLAGTNWVGRQLGQVGVYDDETFEDGLAGTDRGLAVEFFVHVRRPSGATAPIPELSYPFLWYWDAFPTRDGWKYLDGAGRA